MPSVIRVQKGGHVPIYVPIRESRDDSLDGQFFSPVGVTYTILNPDGTSQTPETALNWVSVGRYVIHWNTAALATGDYLLKIRFGQAFSSTTGGATVTGEVDFIIRLVNFL